MRLRCFHLSPAAEAVPDRLIFVIPEMDRVVDPAFLARVSEVSMEQVRAMRAECTDLENGASYIRRLAQGWLDLLSEESKRRSEGGGGSLSELVEGLANMMSEGVRAPGSGRVDQQLEPPDHVVEPLTDVLDAVIGPSVVAGIAELTDAELADALNGIQNFEEQLSSSRRALHGAIDSLNHELARRIAAGDAPARPA